MLPASATWPHLVGVGLLAGIGFTMSPLIAGPAFADPESVDQAKVRVLVVSFAAGVAG